MVATDSEMKDTKKGDGKYLQFEFVVMQGEHEGRKLWDRFNLVNPSIKAVSIGQRQLAKLCRAVGVLRPKESAELHGKPVMAKVDVRKREDSDSFSNDIRGYSAPATNGTKPVMTVNKASTIPPWKK